MKPKYTIITVCAVAIILALGNSFARAGLFSSVMTAGWETRPMDEKYKLEAHMFDLRAYEFTPKANPNISCIALYGETGPTGLECFPKK